MRKEIADKIESALKSIEGKYPEIFQQGEYIPLSNRMMIQYGDKSNKFEISRIDKDLPQSLRDEVFTALDSIFSEA